MIFSWLVLVILGLLMLASYLDLKYKAVPSVLLTAGIFVALMVNPENLLAGVICFVFALMIKDLISDMSGLNFGIADVKIFVIFGLLLHTPIFTNLMILIVIFLIFQFVYTVVWRWRVSKEAEMPFIPCLLAIYIAMMFIGGFA